MFAINGNIDEIKKMFKPFGLCEYETRVYFALQVCGKMKASELWKRTEIPQSKIYYTIESLMMKDLVEVTKHFPKEVKAKPFLRFANDFLTERRCLLEEINEKIEEHKEMRKATRKYVQVFG